MDENVTGSERDDLDSLFDEVFGADEDDADGNDGAESESDNASASPASADNDGDGADSDEGGDNASSDEDDDADAEGDGNAGAEEDTEALEEINSAFGLSLSAVSELKNAKRFSELRALGLSAEEAFRASNSEMIPAPSSRNGGSGKSHLRSDTARGAVKPDLLTNTELRELRRWFPDKTDAEIKRLCRSTAG